MRKILKVKPHEQQTFLSCLSASFLMTRNYYEGTKLSKENEIKYFIKALSYVKDFYQFGFFVDAEKDGYDTGFITEVPNIYNYLKILKNKYNTKTELSLQHINLDFVKKYFLEKNTPLVLLVDQWPFSMYTRTQHYILVTGVEEGYVNIVEPWYGKEMKIPDSTMQNSFDSLRNNLFCGIQILYLKK